MTQKVQKWHDRFGDGTEYGGNRLERIVAGYGKVGGLALGVALIAAMAAYFIGVMFASSVLASVVALAAGYFVFKRSAEKVAKRLAEDAKNVETLHSRIKRYIKIALAGFGAWFAAASVLEFVGFGAKAWTLWKAVIGARLIEVIGPVLKMFGLLAPGEISKAVKLLADPTVKLTYGFHFQYAPMLSALVGLAVFYLVGRYLMNKAIDITEELKDRHRRGRELLTVEQLKEQVATVDPEKGWGGVSDLTWVGGIPIAKGRETYHFYIMGATGAGKSQALHPLMKQVRAKGKGAVVYDKTGEFSASYYDASKDILLNPFDARFCEAYGGGWTIFNEVNESTDYLEIAKALLPIKNPNDGTEAYFKGGGAIVVGVIMEELARLGRGTNKELVEMLFMTDQKDLYEMFKHTAAARYLNPDSSGTGSAGFFTTLQLSLDILRYIPDGDFSIKDFCWTADDRWLFMPTPAKRENMLQPFLSLVMNIASGAVRDATRIKPNQGDRLWFFMDEFASMGHGPMKALETLAVEARQFGVVLVCALQNEAQAESLMDKNRAATFKGQLQNKLIMRVSVAESAESASKDIGSHEVDSLGSSISGGPDQSKDSTGHNWSVKDNVKLVLADEIMSLSPNSGYLILAGGYMPAKVSWTPQAYPEINPREVARTDLQLSKRSKKKAAEPIKEEAPEPVESQAAVEEDWTDASEPGDMASQEEGGDVLEDNSVALDMAPAVEEEPRKKRGL